MDIITMSFGFPQGDMEIEQQITHATQREKNILVFAAASNDGRNSSRMYPARNRSVFAIHSTNGKGIKSDFNPPLGMDQNLSVLGEYIESAWQTSKESNGCTRRLSGTSFATPIAVCLSAFLLAYVPMLIPSMRRCSIRFRATKACATCCKPLSPWTRSTRGHDISISPWRSSSTAMRIL